MWFRKRGCVLSTPVPDSCFCQYVVPSFRCLRGGLQIAAHRDELQQGTRDACTLAVAALHLSTSLCNHSKEVLPSSCRRCQGS